MNTLSTNPSPLNPIQTRISSDPIIYQQSNYNPGLKPALLEAIFGYSRQTFRNWEHDKRLANPATGESKIRTLNGPILYPTILENKSSPSKPLRLYTINDVLAIYKWLNETGESIPRVNKPLSIAVWNNKGGVGKTTVVQQLASTLSILMGLKVLIIDTDSQSDCTMQMDCLQEFEDVPDQIKFQPTIRDVIGYEELDPETKEYEAKQTPLSEALIHLSPTLSVLPADEDVSDLDYDLKLLAGKFWDDKTDVSQLASVKVLQDQIFRDFNYDVILYDCAPNKGLLNLNILYAANRLLIPVDTDAKCIHSLKRVTNFLELLSTRISSKFDFDKVLGIPNKFTTTKTIKRKALGRLEEIFGNTILSDAILPDATVLDNTVEHRRPVFIDSFDTTSSTRLRARKLTNELWLLAHEILNLQPSKMLFPEASGDIEL